MSEQQSTDPERCSKCGLPLSRARVEHDDGSASHYPDCGAWWREACQLMYGRENDDMTVAEVRELLMQIGEGAWLEAGNARKLAELAP